MKLRRVSKFFGAKDGALTATDAEQSRPAALVHLRKTLRMRAKTGVDTYGSDHSIVVLNLHDALEKLSQLLHFAHRPMPTETADGTYVSTIKATGGFEDLLDLEALLVVLKQQFSGHKWVNDRTMFMERVMQILATLPPTSMNRMNMTNSLIGELWSSLSHPPQAMLGAQYQYRHADGSFNNPQSPDMGKAGSAYARSVTPQIIQPSPKPDAGLIFDTIMSRENGGFKPHPNKVSSVLFYFATIIIHDCFRTSREDHNISASSSYLELSPLYGSNQKEQDWMRTFCDGKIKPDCFSEKRLLGFPPGVGCLLFMFNRFHNYVVEQLALINENGKFSLPREGLAPQQQKEASRKRDNHLFQVGRLVTCGLYVNIILVDYFRTIIGMNRVKSNWSIDPRPQIDDPATPRGTGNQVSVEFNLLYRWHSCISQRDEGWTKSMYKRVFGKDFKEVTPKEFIIGLSKLDQITPDDPLKREYPDLQRGMNGNFSDDDLAAILTASIDDIADSFGANNVPEVMRAVSSWFFGLVPHKTFEDINPDPAVASKMKALFNHPDFVELYPGLVCEETKNPMTPGVGIAPTYTISRAILSDAVTLVRWDRFYTIDHNATNLTHWGFREIEYDLAINQGCVLYKLILRSFPNHFKFNSIYAHYPMTVPCENKEIMTTLGRIDDFDWEKPGRAAPKQAVVTYNGVKSVLTDIEPFTVEPWSEGIRFLFGKPGGDFMLSGDGDFFLVRREQMSKCLYQENWVEIFKTFFESTTLNLVERWSSNMLGNTKQVDIIRDVGNLAFAHFAASMFSLPMKTKMTPNAIFTEHEIYGMLTVAYVHCCFFGDADPVTTFPLHSVAVPLAQGLAQLMEHIVGFVAKAKNIPVRVHLKDGNPLREYSLRAMRHLLDRGLSPHEAVWSQMLPTAVASVAHIACVFGQIVDFYVGAGNISLAEINRLAKLDTAEADSVIPRYVLEGMRLTGTFGAMRACKKDVAIHDGPREIRCKESDKIYCEYGYFFRDPTRYPEPDKVKLDRPIDSYHLHGAGPHECLGQLTTRVALMAMLKVVGGLDNLRRAPGPQGQLEKVVKRGSTMYLDANEGRYFPFPTGMKVLCDGHSDELGEAAAGGDKALDDGGFSTTD